MKKLEKRDYDLLSKYYRQKRIDYDDNEYRTKEEIRESLKRLAEEKILIIKDDSESYISFRITFKGESAYFFTWIEFETPYFLFSLIMSVLLVYLLFSSSISLFNLNSAYNAIQNPTAQDSMQFYSARLNAHFSIVVIIVSLLGIIVASSTTRNRVMNRISRDIHEANLAGTSRAIEKSLSEINKSLKIKVKGEDIIESELEQLIENKIKKDQFWTGLYSTSEYDKDKKDFPLNSSPAAVYVFVVKSTDVDQLNKLIDWISKNNQLSEFYQGNVLLESWPTFGTNNDYRVLYVGESSKPNSRFSPHLGGKNGDKYQKTGSLKINRYDWNNLSNISLMVIQRLVKSGKQKDVENELRNNFKPLMKGLENEGDSKK